MRQRAISAVIFTIAMLGGVFGGPVPFFVLFLLITAGSLWELLGLLLPQEPNAHWRRIAGVVFGSLPYVILGSRCFIPSVALANPAEVLSTAVIVLLLLSALLLALELFLQSEQPFHALAHYLLGVVYVGAPFTLLVAIAYGQDHYAPMRVLGLLLLNWTNDTMAYMVGSQIGKRPFFSRISPKKTWEGTLGGVLFTFGIAYVLSLFIQDFTLAEWLALAACVAVFGTLGDLVESMLKRSVRVKDSGVILPGHGGFLDRFDSFIFVLPFAWLILAILKI